MRNTETVTAAATKYQAKKAGALRSETDGNVFSYKVLIAEKVGPLAYNVLKAGGYSATTSKHCNGVARELHLLGYSVERV